MNKIIIFITILSIHFSLKNQLKAQCFLSGVPSWGLPLNTTGSPKLDEILSKETALMESEFAVDVNIYAYDDGKSPNAYAISNPYSIIIGKTLMLDEFVNTENANSIIAIMAHEFGHIVQYKFKLNTYKGWVGKWPELHADFLAGWYMGKKQYINPKDFEKIINSFWDKGDDNFFSSNHHGTPEERAFAFIKGYLSANLNIKEAYTFGTNFIINISSELQKLNNNNNNNESNNKKEITVKGELQKTENNWTFTPSKYKDNCKYPTPIPNDINETINKCNSLFMNNDYEKCAYGYTFIIAKYPDYCVSYFNRALAFAKWGKTELANQDFQKAYELGMIEAGEYLIK